MAKKTILLIFSTLLLLFLVGCGGEDDKAISATQDHEITINKNGEKIKATRKEIYEKSFDNCQWKFVAKKDNKGEDIVFVNGTIKLLNKEITVERSYYYTGKGNEWGDGPVTVDGKSGPNVIYLDGYVKNKYAGLDTTVIEILLAWNWREYFDTSDVKLTDEQIEALVKVIKKNNDKQNDKNIEAKSILANQNLQIVEILKAWGGIKSQAASR